MDLNPTSEQRQLIEAFAGLFRDHASPAAVQSVESTGFDSGLWQRLVDTGVVAMALPEDCGGFGASLLDLALVAEQYGRALAPAPLVEAVVAARLLARVGALDGLLDPAELAEGRRTVTLAVRPAEQGRAELVPAGAVSDDAVILAGDRLVLAPLATSANPVTNLGRLPLADVALTGEEQVLASGTEAVKAFALAVDEWRVLTASALSGLSYRALEIGVEYVKERKAFGKVLGQFQAVAHRLADRATEVHGLQLLTREAAWAGEQEPDRVPELAAMALGMAAEVATATTHDALHFHGGYGFMVEYPIQMYYRRARAWAAVLESPADSFRRVGARQLAAAGVKEATR